MAIIKSENWDGVTAPAIPAGWTVDAPLVTATTNSPTSAPNSLVHPAVSANASNVPHATWGTPDTNSGNVQLSATLRYANTGAGAAQQEAWVFARSSVIATNAAYGTLSYYYAGIVRNDVSAGFFLHKRVAGTDTVLGTVGAAAFADATNYRITLSCVGSAIQAACQRLSDSFWLNSSGVFVADPTNSTWAIAVVDASIAAAAGYSGVAFYVGNTSGGDIGVDDWLLQTTSAATISASAVRLQAGSGPQAVQITGAGTSFDTTSSTQFTLSGGTGASIVSQSAQSATAATLQIDPGTASGTLTITDRTDGSITTTLAVQATYYVSPSGSDANTGLDPAHAWQTIAHVNAQTLHAGDQVLFAGGATHSGNLVVQQSGSAAHPILIGCYGSGQATISPGPGTGIQLLDCDYVRVSNLAVAGPGVTLVGTTISTSSTGAGVEVISTQTQSGSVSAWRQSVYLDRLTISGCRWGISAHSYGGAAAPGPYPVGYNDLRITNCTVSQCAGLGGITVWSNNATTGPYLGLQVGQQLYHKNLYVAGCTVSDIYGDDSVTVSWTGSGIVVSNTQGGTIERCVAANCGGASGSTSKGGPVAIWAYACDKLTIQYCEAHHQHDPRSADGGGFDLDGGCTACSVQYCYSHDNDAYGFAVGTYTNSGPTQNNVLRYNISQNDGRTKRPTGFVGFGAPSTTTVHNCVFYAASSGVAGQAIVDRLEGSGSYAFYNNIFWCGPGVGLFRAVSGGTFAGNLYWFGGGPFSVFYGGTTFSSLGAFQAVQENVGGLPSGLFADPALRAPGSGGSLLPAAPASALDAYALRPSSPAIDAGLDLRVLVGIDPGPLDFTGHPIRVGTSYDIGACESGAAALAGGGGVRRVHLAGGIGG